MTKRVVVWGTGNVGRPAVRAVAAHRELDLVGVIVADPDKVGRDAGELTGIGPLGVTCTDDPDTVLTACSWPKPIWSDACGPAPT